jgi:hypothetical protein
MRGDSAETTAHNIGIMAIWEAEMVVERLPFLPNFRYDPSEGTFYDDRNAPLDPAQLSDTLTKRIAGIDPRFTSRIGEATARRALATLGVLSGRETGSLQPGGRSDPIQQPSPALKKVLYSKCPKFKADQKDFDWGTEDFQLAPVTTLDGERIQREKKPPPPVLQKPKASKAPSFPKTPLTD